MKLKSENGYTGIEIATAVIILFIFVSAISMLGYNINSIANEIRYQGEAALIAINEIEQIKKQPFENIDENVTEKTNVQSGFYKTVNVQDYHDIDESKEADLVKNVTVEISYIFKKEEKTVTLSTILAKENL